MFQTAAELVLYAVRKSINHIAFFYFDAQRFKMLSFADVAAYRHVVAFQLYAFAFPDNHRRLIGYRVIHFHFLHVKTADCHVHTVVNMTGLRGGSQCRFDKFAYAVENRSRIFGVVFRYHKLFQCRNAKH